MRILLVRFKNLNSLVGEWEIDLTHPAFASDGIFAITGPTGAGKTTILDAICLALYGRTPRLNKVTKSGNEIMSRQSGECFAEVTFETQAGRYRCHWSQHRSRKKSDGELQAPKHEIANADSGEIFESKIRGVADQIEAATGMDFERFTRSMLLAQGGFDTFLKADADKRAPILEQITGTEIYSRISIRVHECHRDEIEKLKLLQAETAGIVVLELEQEKEILQTLEAKQQEEAELAAKCIDTGKSIVWLNTIDALKKEIANLADEASKLQIDIEAFRPDREKLNLALNAASLDGSYATLTSTRKQQVDDSAALKNEEEALPLLESSFQEKAESLKSAELQSVRVKDEMKAAAPTLHMARSLDQKIASLKEAISESDEDCKKDAAKIDADKKFRLEEQGKQSSAHEALKIVVSYLEENVQDEWLISGLAGVEEQLGSLLSKQDEILQKETERDKATNAVEQAKNSLNDCQKNSGTLKNELEDALKQLQQGKDALSQLLGERMLREYRAEKEALLREMAFLAKIAELEDHRTKLEDGKPCPLCGATEHPFAEGNVPTPDDTEQKVDALSKLIRKAEDQEAIIKQLSDAESLARINLTEAEKLEAAATNNMKTAEITLADVKISLEKLQADFSERRQTVSSKLLPLGITEIPTNVASLLDTLKARLNAWQAQFNKKTDIEKQIAEIDSEIKRLDAIVENQNTSLAGKLVRLDALKNDLATSSDERIALYCDRNPDEEERRLNKAISDAENTEKQTRDLHIETQQRWNTAKTHVESLKKRTDLREPELNRQEMEFASALTCAGFSSEEQFLAAILSSDQKNELIASLKELDERQTQLKARQNDREARLAAEIALKVTEKLLEELEPQFKEYEKALQDLRDIIAGLKYKLSENAVASELIKEKQVAIEAQKNECRRWDNLHALIGSADGKKYRNFAQGLTFEMMVSHANRQLQKMTDRYLLVRDDAQPLELNVVDNYQAGEIRSTKNLSGGESFIVSLSLALGLSHMASKNVRVDSLFLDEGFGTLDEDALEIALDTLSNLQQEGKLIGIISHVQALKERISTQIRVSPLNGGKSTLEGSGCRRL